MKISVNYCLLSIQSKDFFNIIMDTIKNSSKIEIKIYRFDYMKKKF